MLIDKDNKNKIIYIQLKYHFIYYMLMSYDTDINEFTYETINIKKKINEFFKNIKIEYVFDENDYNNQINCYKMINNML